ncbi:MAG: oxygenase [Flavobacteriia bacterium]|nr:MAG: oxygenase [Alphaproteobacteria bacterium]TAF76986.1 MAG: oxygenase [Alphaproteobacteria bacterium]TAF84496.1 MAG: oxygenase [Flavobacteriia bacterium]
MNNTENYEENALHSPLKRENIITLTNEEKELIRETLGAIHYDPEGGKEYIMEIRRAAYMCFPERLITALEEQKAGLHPHSYLYFENLPYEDVEGSPEESKGETGLDYKCTPLSENITVALGALSGEPYSIIFEGKEIVNNLVPSSHMKQTYTGNGYDVELSFHIENAAQKDGNLDKDTSPGALVLVGVRHDESCPKTRIADGRDALALLSDEDKETLRKADFRIKVPMRWRAAGAREMTDRVPILTGTDENPDIRVAFYPDMVLSVNERAQEAFEHLKQAVDAVSCWVDIAPGTGVMVNNRMTLHSRDRFEAHFDAQGKAERWIQRVFVKNSLQALAQFEQSGERVFDPSHPKISYAERIAQESRHESYGIG